MSAKDTKRSKKAKQNAKTAIIPIYGPIGSPTPYPYTPLPDVDRLFRAMQSRFTDPFALESFPGSHPSIFPNLRPAYSDIEEGDEAFVIRSELPGVKKEDVNISIKDGRVEISAESREENFSREKEAVYRERSQGRFFRAFHLSDKVNFDKAEAKFENGVLTLTLPKKRPAASEKRTLPVK